MLADRLGVVLGEDGGDDHVAAVDVLAGADALDLGGGEGVHGEDADVLVPFDDVDLLAVELVDDGLDAAAAHADAGADGVDLGIEAAHGELGAETGVAGDAHDFDDAFLHLGDLLHEQRPDEVHGGAGEDDAGRALVLLVLDAQQQRAELLGLVEVVRRQLVLAVEDRLAAAFDLADAVATAHLLDGGGDDLADLGQIALVDDFALRVANVLHERLLGGLRGDAAEVARRGLDLDHVARLGVGLDAPRHLHGDEVRPLLGVADDQRLEGRDLAGARVDRHAHVAGGAEAPLFLCIKKA